MYYCRDCKKFVKGSDWEVDILKKGGSEVCCDNCGSVNLVEAYKCEVCGEPTLDTYCDWCLSEARSVAKAFIGDSKRKAELLEDMSDKIWMELHKLESSKPKSKVKHI